jgi:UDP-N-acetylmuramoyl-L-alanyl-D-glutamate--2,6-diaminopimelate ligase
VEFHGSWEQYFLAKARLFTELGQGKPAVLNADDAHFNRLRQMIDGPVLTYGIESSADLRAVEIQTTGQSSCFVLEHGFERVPVTVPMPGRFNVLNALAVFGLARAAGISTAAIADGLAHATPPPGRLQRIDLGQPFEVIVDYAHTMHAFRSVLGTMRQQTPPQGRLIAVFGATGNRDREKRPVLGQIARELADLFFITNEDPYDEQADAIIAQVASGLPPDDRGSHYHLEPDRGIAIERALQEARPGDVVVILGKGHEQSMVVNGQKKPWSDLLAVQRSLEARV